MKKVLLIACLLAVCSVSANAELLVDYRFNTDAAYASDPNAIVSIVSAGPGIAADAGRSGSGQNQYARSTGTGPIIIANAIAAEDYHTFTVQPVAADVGLDLESMTLKYGHTSTGVPMPQTMKLYLLTSIDGFVDATSIVDSETITVVTASSSVVYTDVTFDLSGVQVSALGAEVEFRFYLADTTNLNDFIHRIDDVKLYGTYGLPTLDARSPENGATVVVDDLPTLDWTPNASVESSVDVYFQTDPTDPNLFLVSAADADGTYDPGVLAYDSTYSWTLVTYEPNEFGTPVPNPAEPVWSFTTAGENPEITVDPVSQTIDASTTLSVTALRAESYQWFKDGAAIGGADSNSLVLSGVLADEADYHCEAYNASFPAGSPHPDAISDVARIMTARLAGWWKLDGNLTDSVATVVAGAPTHDGASVSPLYVGTGVVGTNALDLSAGIAANLVGIADPNFFNFYPQGYSVSCWVKLDPAAPADWGPAVAKDDRDNPGTAGFRVDTDTNFAPVHTLRGPGSVHSNVDTKTDGGWHLVTGTWDADTNLSKIYVDGVIAATDAPYYGAIPVNTADLVFGSATITGLQSTFYKGLLDEVKIYTYALTPEEISAEYQAVVPGEQCIHPDDFLGVEYDVLGNNNCKVDLPDFAAFAAKWLGTGLFTAP